MVKFLLDNNKKIKKIIIFSRDELKQFEMSKVYDPAKFSNLRYFIGDIRDKNRLKFAMENVDFVIHAAALKQIETAEYNPIETIKTNVLGVQNVIEAAIYCGVRKVLSLSTDKAVSPFNLYGATKLCAEKLFVSANSIVGIKKITFSSVRYGNVLGSRGSVLPIFLKQKKDNLFTITHKKMTRFNLTLDAGIKLVLWTLKNSIGSEIVIPKIPSIKIIDLAKAINSKAKIKYVGTRLGEKLHEDLITESESSNILELKDKYILLPEKKKKFINHYKKIDNKFKIPELFTYNSFNNKKFLNVKEIKSLLKKEKFL